MNSIYGQFDESMDFEQNHLNIRLSEDCLQQYWAHCSLLSDFLADYYGYLTPGRDEEAAARRTEWKHNIRYLINELMENAVKFRKGGDITVAVDQSDRTLTFVISNLAALEKIEPFQALLSEICQGDPGELLLEKIERNALDPENAQESGLGFLTLMNDYGVGLGWRFAPSPLDAEAHIVHTMARMQIE